jgi:hypothetical protein
MADDAGHAVLEARPLTPTNVNVFSPGAYPAATPMVPAAGPPPTEAQVAALLQAYLEAQFPNDPQAIARGQALFADPGLIAKVPNPSLRAGLIGLMGTVGEPAIDFVRSEQTPAGLSKVNLVDFDSLPWDPSDTGTARSIVNPDSLQMSVIFNPKYQSENPFLFTSIHAHEALHSDTHVAGTEEAINLAIQTYVYLEQLVHHPDLASIDTELTRRSNTNALARLNSGADDHLGLFESNNHEPILPGSPLPATSWWGQFSANTDLVDTAGNPLLRAYLANMAEPGGVVPASPNFDMATLQFIDGNSAKLAGALESTDGLRVFDTLGLASVEEGDAGANQLIGVAISDRLSGRDGDDDLQGQAGDDTINGNRGGDNINGNRGDDVIHGGLDADVVRGGQGNDMVFGDDGDDRRVSGDMGSDTVHGGGGADTVFGGAGDDIVDGDDGDDGPVNGNIGSDTVHGGAGDDRVLGGQGNDRLFGDEGNDLLSGDLGSDTLTGGSGADSFRLGVNGAQDTVSDFSAADGDRVIVDRGATYALSQAGADAIVTLSTGEQLTLQGVTASALPNGWIVVA